MLGVVRCESGVNMISVVGPSGGEVAFNIIVVRLEKFPHKIAPANSSS